MPSPNRRLPSPDPWDLITDPSDHLVDPVDQATVKGQLSGDGLGGADLGGGDSRGGDFDDEPRWALADDEPPWVPAEQIKALRRRLRITQLQFAHWFGFSAATLRHWERGNRKPTGSALVLLRVIRDNP